MKPLLLATAFVLTTSLAFSQSFPEPGLYIESAQYSSSGGASNWDSLYWYQAVNVDSFRLKERIYQRVDGAWDHIRGWIHFGDQERIDSSYIYVFSNGDSVISDKQLYRYDQGVEVYREFQRRDPFTQGFVTNFKMERTLNQEGLIELQKVYAYAVSTLSIQLRDSIFYRYDANNELDSVITFTRSNDTMRLAQISSHDFNAAGDEVYREHFLVNNDTTPQMRLSVEYDGLGRHQETVQENWNGLAYYTSILRQSQYSGNSSKLTEHLYLFHDTIEGVYKNQSLQWFEYDSVGNLTNHEAYRFLVLGDTQGNYRFSYKYAEAAAAPPTGIEEPLGTSTKFFPNPTTDFVTVEAAEDTRIQRIYMHDLQGKHVQQIEGQAKHRVTIPLKELSNGMYIMTLLKTDGSIETLRFMH